MTTLEAVLGRRPGWDETAERLAEGFRRVHGLTLEPGGLTAAETALMESLAREKYGTAEWTRAGRVVDVVPRPAAASHS
jgi:lipoate-protein ligase A